MTTKIKSTEVKLRSRILEFFTMECLIDLTIVRLSPGTNIERGEEMLKVLERHEVPFTLLGTGTNRIGIQIDGYVFKLGLDREGMVDNCREFKYGDKMKACMRGYEILPDGFVFVCEAFMSISKEEFLRNREKIIDVLDELSDGYLIGDIGLDVGNYINWGVRKGTSGLGFGPLDYAHIYPINANHLRCKTDDCLGFVRYTDDYTKLICNSCGKIYNFTDIHGKFKDGEEKKEIGDVMEMTYNLSSVSEIHPRNDSYTERLDAPPKDKLEKKQAKKERKKFLKEVRNNVRMRNEGDSSYVAEQWRMKHGDVIEKYQRSSHLLLKALGCS